MLQRRLKINREDGVTVGETPLLVPAVSSRVNLPIKDLIQSIEEFVTGPLLVSAYDVNFSKKKFPKVTFPDLIFLDSGGYECNIDQYISDIGMYNPNPKKWTHSLYKKTLEGWNTDIPTVFISFDHPKVRKPLEEQISDANKLLSNKKDYLKELLVKPETKKSHKVNIERLSKCVNLLSDFNIIGFTEKELGNSVLDRMVSIAKIRQILDDENITIPVHIFGSLDPVVTPLYYFAGADIFDGLSWLRFMFKDGDTLYHESFGPKQYGVQVNLKTVWGATVSNNYNYMQKLKLDLESFSKTKNLETFGKNADFYKRALEYLSTRMEVK